MGRWGDLNENERGGYKGDEKRGIETDRKLEERRKRETGGKGKGGDGIEIHRMLR